MGRTEAASGQPLVTARVADFGAVVSLFSL
jgi:hypothetical protein